MSTTQDAPADTRTPAEQAWFDAAVAFGRGPEIKDEVMFKTVSLLGALLYAVHAEVEELRESKATKALVQELAEALALQATELKTLRERVDQVTGDTAPAPTMEAVIAEIEAAGWSLDLHVYHSTGFYAAHIKNAVTGNYISGGMSRSSAVAALQEALTTARQAVQG